MHWLHGVPPGSSEQLPPSTGLPQWLPLHTSGVQHCGVVLQVDPNGRQPPVPHTLLVHAKLQHSSGVVHG
jgi:hypothetical protein